MLSSNGRSLGNAFERFSKENEMYFPALTLLNEENVSVNLGERPFKFPIPGANPVVDNPKELIDYFKRLEPLMNSLIDNQISLQANVSFALCFCIYL